MAAYVIADIEVTDQEGFDRYRPLAGASVEQYGGRYVVRGGDPVNLEGDWNPTRIVVLEFESVEAARRWYESPEYSKALPLRQAASEGRVIIVQGP